MNSDAILDTGRKEDRTSICTYCGKCMPCPKGINIPEIIRIMNDIEQYGRVTEEIEERYRDIGGNAAKCIACKRCEVRCRTIRIVPIVLNMRKAARLLKRWGTVGRKR